MKISNKSQIITLDLGTSMIMFVVFIAIFIILFLLVPDIDKEKEFELEYVFANLENNLKFAPNNMDFLSNYRIDAERLTNFANTVNDIDEYVIGAIGEAHGIGLDKEGFDTCLYFAYENQFIDLDSSADEKLDALGTLKSGNCNQKILLSQNPCDGYKQAFSFFKPVLFDEGNPRINRIVQMNIIICEK